jgi:hypothetical protein
MDWLIISYLIKPFHLHGLYRIEWNAYYEWEQKWREMIVGYLKILEQYPRWRKKKHEKNLDRRPPWPSKYKASANHTTATSVIVKYDRAFDTCRTSSGTLRKLLFLCYYLNSLKPGGPVCTTCFNILKLCILPTSVFVCFVWIPVNYELNFCILLRSSD